MVAGCLLDSSAPRGPPDVPPRNPAMSRLNGRLPGSHAASDHERDPDLEPSCLVRTPSGNFYNIPSKSTSAGIVKSDLVERRSETSRKYTWETVFSLSFVSILYFEIDSSLVVYRKI